MNEKNQGVALGSLTGQIARARSQAMLIGCWAAVLCLFFIPINKPLTNLCMAIALLGTVVGPDFLKRLRKAASHPVALGAMLWWAVLALSAMYAPQSTALWRSWFGLLAFSYPLLVLSLIGHDERWRVRAWWSFGAAMGLVVLISWGQFAGLIPQRALSDGSGIMRNVVFKDYTQQGLATLCLASLLFAVVVWRRTEATSKYIWMGIVCCLLSVLFVIESRTAWLSTIPLIFLWCTLVFFKGSWGKKLAWVMLLTICLGAGLAWWQADQNQSRLTQIGQEIQANVEQKQVTSSGIRLELWRQSLQLIKQAPIFGHGFDQWHPQFIAQTRDIPAYEPYRMRFPHQEFLLIMVEQGLLGFVFYCVMLCALALYIRGLALPHRHFYAAFLLLYLTAGAANSLLADFSHRHLLLVWLGFMPWVSKLNDAQGERSELEAGRSA